jgi:hypothetical protein
MSPRISATTSTNKRRVETLDLDLRKPKGARTSPSSMTSTSSRRVDATLDTCTQAQLKSCVDEVVNELDTRYVRVFVKNTNIMDAVQMAETVFGSRAVVSFSVSRKHMLVRRYEGGTKTEVQKKLLNDGEYQGLYSTASDLVSRWTDDHKIDDKTQGGVMLGNQNRRETC